MSLSHYDPLANLRLFEDAFSRMLSEPQTNRPWAPAVDIYETENELASSGSIVTTALPARNLDVA